MPGYRATVIVEQIRRTPLAVLAVCAYVVAFPIPFEWDLPLLVLALLGGLAVVVASQDKTAPLPRLFVPVAMFLIATGISILASADLSRSLTLSVSLLPATFIFYLIGEHFDVIRHIRVLYASYSLVGLVISSMLLWTVFRSPEGTPSAWISGLSSPALVVPNDVIFLAIVSPLSLSLFLCAAHRPVKILAGVSILCSVLVIILLQSRGALLAVLLSMGVAAGLMRPRMALGWGLTMLVLLSVVDGTLGFPLLNKFRNLLDPRLSLWLAAWAMFADAPVLGYGPHTYGIFYQHYLTGLHLPTWLTAEPPNTTWAHNLYLEVLAEQGLLGLMALGVLLLAALRRAWRLRQAAHGETRAYAVGALAGLIGMCCAAVYELSLLRLWVVVTLFSCLGVVACLSRLNPEVSD